MSELKGQKIYKLTIEAYLAVPDHESSPVGWDGMAVLAELADKRESWWVEVQEIKPAFVENENGARFLRLDEGEGSTGPTVRIMGPLPGPFLSGISKDTFEKSFKEVSS